MSGSSAAAVRGRGALAGYTLVDVDPCPAFGCPEAIYHWADLALYAREGRVRSAYAHGEGEAVRFIDEEDFAAWEAGMSDASVVETARWLESLHREGR